MKIAVAQTIPIKGDIPSNIKGHKKLISLAVSYKADAIFFPELSMTAYEPKLAKELATTANDIRFDEFQTISNTNNLTIGFGLPTKASSGIRISLLIFQPNSERQFYSKQQLHSDEFPYFVPGEQQLLLTVKDEKIALAICFESLQTQHAENAYKLGAQIYVACVAKSQIGIDRAIKHYSEVAKKFSIPVLMSNCVGYCDNFKSVGKSSVFTKQGIQASQLDDKLEGVLIFDTETEEVTEQSL